MWSFSVVLVTLTLGSFLPQAAAQFAQCIQTCIDQYTSQSCKLADFPCICRQSSGNFLPSVVSCAHDACDSSLDSSIFLTSLSLICQLAGAPLPASAFSSAQNEASSLAVQPATVTATVTKGSGTTGGGGPIPTSATAIPGDGTTATVSGQALSWSGPTTSTFFGASGSMTTSPTSTASSSGGFVGFIPIVITTTNSAGSTYISTASRPGALSTYTTTDSRGATVVQTSTYTQSNSSGAGQGSSSDTSSVSPFSSSVSSSARSSASGSSAAGVGSGLSSSRSSSTTRSIRTSTIFTPERTSAGGSTTTSTASRDGSTDSAPFTNTNAGPRKDVRSWLGFSVFLAVLELWS